MNVGSSTHQCSALPLLAPGNIVGPELNGRDVKLVNSSENDMQQILHRVNCHMPWYSRQKTLVLSGRNIKFANPTNAIQRLLHRIRCHISPPDPLDRKRTSDNKENPCDLATRPTTTIGQSEAEPPRLNATQMSALNAIRISAREYGGEVVFKFSHSKGEFYKQISMHSFTKEGVCKALCDHWLACHANGLSLFDGLYVGGQKGQFNIDMLISIKQLNIDALSEGGCASQFRVSNDWMENHGIEPESCTIYEHSEECDEIRPLLDCMIASGQHKAVHLALKNGNGHCVAAHTTEKCEIRFFDPNYGDFKFPNPITFEKWFRAKFWPLSGYSYKTMHTFNYKNANNS